MSDKILLRRGNRADLPALNVGEPGFATDTKEFFVGATGGNKRIYAPYDKVSNFRASQGGVQSLLAATYTKINFATLVYDNTGEYSTLNSRFTATEAGEHLVLAQVRWASQPDGNITILAVYKNGVEDSRIYQGSTGAVGVSISSGACKVRLNANDYIEIYGYTTNALNTDNSFSFFEMIQLAK